jgi:hypothetical protein
VIFTVLTFLLSVAVGALFSWHAFLVLTNMTSVDHLILGDIRAKQDAQFCNPFCLGSLAANARASLLSAQGGWFELVVPPMPWWDAKGPPFPGAQYR